VPAVLCVVVAVAAILRLTVRDRWPVVAVLVYATPPVVLAAVMFVAGALWFLRREPRYSLLALAVAVAFQFWWATASWVLNPPSPENSPPGTVRGLFWNLRRGDNGWEEVSARIQEWDPDVAWFVEAEEPGGGAPWLEELRGYDTRRVGDGLVVIARGTIGVVRPFPVGTHGHGAEIWVAAKNQTFGSVVVDLDSSLFARRREQFEELNREIEAMRDPPAIIAGDFNTPRDSIHLDSLRKSFRNAFEVAGRGYDATWPLPVPLICIDQIWAAERGAAIRSCRLPWTRASDHRPVLIEFTAGQ